MASYHVFFRRPDPPHGTVESNQLQRVRTNRNLTRRLNILKDSCDWMGALRLVRNVERGNPLVRAGGSHYALIVRCFLNSHTGSDQSSFINILHEKIVTREIPYNTELVLAVLTFYQKIDKLYNALNLLVFARDRGIYHELESRASSLLLRVAEALNRHGLWKPSLEITANLAGNPYSFDKYNVKSIRAKSHAIHGSWMEALTLLLNSEKANISSADKMTCEDTQQSLRVYVAHSAIVTGHWELSLECILRCSKSKRIITDDEVAILWKTCIQDIYFLQKAGRWIQALTLARLFQKNFSKNILKQRMEIIHAKTLEMLLLSRQWNEAIRYFMHDCDESSFETDLLRETSAKVLVAAGRSEAAQRILRVSQHDIYAHKNETKMVDQKKSEFDITKKRVNVKKIESTCTNEPSLALLHFCDVADDTLQRVREMPPSPSRVKKIIEHSNIEILPDSPLSSRWIPKALFNRRFLNPENGYSVNFSQESFSETSPPPPTNYYDRSCGWTYWNQNFGLPSCKKKKLRTAYCFSKTASFQNIPSYKRSWKKYQLMRNLFHQ